MPAQIREGIQMTPGRTPARPGTRIGRICDAFLEALMQLAELPPEPGIPELTDAHRRGGRSGWQLAPFAAVPVLVTGYREPA
jgi:hypothetical protein